MIPSNDKKRWFSKINVIKIFEFTQNFDDVSECFCCLLWVVWCEKEFQIDLNLRQVAAAGRRVSLEPVTERSDDQLKQKKIF